MATLPVVDMNALRGGDSSARQREIQGFGEAFRNYGFAALAGHGVERRRFEQVFEQAALFFALPEAEKQLLVLPESRGNRGYVPFFGEKAVGARVADLKEFFHVGPELIAPEHRAIYQANVWPSQPGFHAFRELTLALYDTLADLAQEVLKALALYLDLEEGHFASMAVGGNSILRLIHYPPVPQGAPEGAIRAAAHEDINLVTLLAESTAGGLEIARPDGSWLPIQSLEGHLVVNAGDMLSLCSGGRIPSTRHRVVNPVGANVPRYSVPFFTHPRPEVILPQTGPGADPQKSILTHDFLEQRLRAIQAG